MRQLEKVVKQTELVHQFERRRVHRIAAKIAKEIIVLLENGHRDAGCAPAGIPASCRPVRPRQRNTSLPVFRFPCVYQLHFPTCCPASDAPCSCAIISKGVRSRAPGCLDKIDAQISRRAAIRRCSSRPDSRSGSKGSAGPEPRRNNRSSIFWKPATRAIMRRRLTTWT